MRAAAIAAYGQPPAVHDSPDPKSDPNQSLALRTG